MRPPFTALEKALLPFSGRVGSSLLFGWGRGLPLEDRLTYSQ